MNKCICDWCNREQNRSGKGYCRKHYDQIRKYGHIVDDVRGSWDDNRIEIKGDYAEVVITDCKDNVQGIAKISIGDVEAIKGHHWSDNGNGYIRCFINNTPIYLHRYLTNCPDNMDVDHINHDKYDNTRNNLRIVTHAVNCQNRVANCVRYISDRALTKPYMVRIIKHDKLFYCKYFATEQEAINKVKELRALDLQTAE